MFPGRENPKGTANLNMENLFVHVFESKRRIVEQVKQGVDRLDRHLAMKCLISGVSPPPWLLPSQTSEPNKEEIISGLLFPQSRPSSHPFSYQKPVSFLADNVVRPENILDATSPGHSQGKVDPKSVSTTGCDRKPSSPGYFQDEIEPNSGLDPGLPLSKIQRSKSRQKDLELRSSAKASKSRSNSRSELKPSPGGNIGLEIASLRPDCVSQGKGGDQFIKLISSEESSNPHQKVGSVQKSSSGGIFASIVPESPLESGELNEMNVLQTIETIDNMSAKVDEQVDDPQSRSCNETAYLDGGTRSISSSQQSSKREHQKPSSSFSGDIPSRNSNPSHRADHEVELPLVIPLTNEVSMVTDAGTSSNARGNRSKTENLGSDESSSVDVEPRHSISLLKGGDVKESLNPSAIDVEDLVVENTASDDQSKEKGECVDTNRCSSSGRVSQTSISSEDLVAEGVKESLIPSTIDDEDLVVGNITSEDQSKEKGECVKESLIPSTIDVEGLVVDDQSKENGECVDTKRCSRAGRVSQTGISTDETTIVSAIQDSLSKTELLGFVESSSVEVRSRRSVIQSDDENVLLKPVTVTGEALLVEEDNAGESTEISSIPKSRSLSQTDITEFEPVVVESILQESGTLEDSIDNSKKCDTSCGSKEVQPQTQGSLTRAGGNQCHGRLSTPRRSANEEDSTNELKALSVSSDHKTADKQQEVRAENSSLTTYDLPVFMKAESSRFDDNEECNFETEIPMNSREKSSMEKTATLASATMKLDVPSLTDSEVLLSADSEMHDTEDHNGLKKEMVPEAKSPASHTGIKMGENEPPESNAFTGHIDALTKRPQHETSSDNCIPPMNRNLPHCPESSIQEFFCSSSFIEGSKLQNKRRRTLAKSNSRVLSTSPGGDILSDSVTETVHHREEVACHNLNHYDVELQKMIGSASSAELRFEEGYLFKEAGLMSPLNHGFKTEDMDVLPFAGETSHPFASCGVRDSDCSPCLSPLGLIGSVDGSPPVLEGFILHTDDENRSSSKNQIKHDSFQLPRTTAESATMIEQIRKSACKTTPSLHLAKTIKFNGKRDLDQSVSTELLDGTFFSQNLEGSSVFDNLGINLDYTGRLYTDCQPLSGAGLSTDARNPRGSPTEKLWYRSLQKSSSSEKRGSQTPDLPCISEENENVEEEAESLCTNTPKSMNLEKRGSSVLDLPCIAEENENIDEMSEAVNEVSDSEKGIVSAERKPLADVNEVPIQFLPSVSEAEIPVDRQSPDSVNTAFSFSATCNNSVQSKVGRQNGGSRRFTGKGKDHQGGAGAGRNGRPPSSRFSKAKLSCNSSLTTLRPRLPDKEPRHNNIVSNITSFVPLVQQQKPAAALFTGKRDVKVKSLEAAEASKRIAEQKENDRKMKKEAMKLERARLEEENLRKQEMEKKKKEEERKKKEAEMAWKQEMEKKKKEEERKRKEFEMANRKRQREEEKKLKEAKRQRVAEIQRQQREADEKLHAEKELKRQAMDAKIKALKELKETQSNAEKTRGQANSRIPEVRPKSNASDDTNASRTSRDDDFKVISNPGKMSEESYDISPYKCSDDENEEEDDDCDDMPNHKFVPSWASKSNILHTVISQQKRDPDLTFPAKSFPDITQVLLPRKFRSL
ncbi:uncharacterized protein LOC18019656 [Eutrema salsugineum]|uniref:uncharacterized protein LOC18019656 n=1 Tax=Eutrema salsugineum TaxID=72664 RepID=UPI000CED4986|nr:uncharacterized protein LOC18019656 [Eutrema salsugineum]